MKILIVAVLACSSNPAWAAFENLPASARPAGLAGAYTASADDVNALFFNPAGLKEITRPELTMQYGRLLGGLSDGSSLDQGILAFAQPIPGRGTAALGYSSLKLAGLYEERTISVGYGRSFWEDRLGIGLTLKHLHAGFGKDAYSGNAVDSSGNVQFGAQDPVLAGNGGKSAFGMDFGALYRWTSRLRLGFAALNLNRPDAGISRSSPVTRTLALGLSGKLGPGTLSTDLLRQEVLEGQADIVAALGYELRKDYKNQIFFLRGGGRAGSRDQRQANFGLGWRHDALQLDYAMTLHFSGLRPSNDSQLVSLTYRFGRRK